MNQLEIYIKLSVITTICLSPPVPNLSAPTGQIIQNCRNYCYQWNNGRIISGIIDRFWCKSNKLSVFCCKVWVKNWMPLFTQCGLEMPYDNSDLCQHWLRYWLFAWWHIAIIWINVDSPSGESSDSVAKVLLNMMTSSNGNIFCVTGHLCGEFTGPRCIPRIKASDTEVWCFLWSVPE